MNASRRFLALAVVCVLVAAMLVPAAAFARAGGGHIGSPGRSGGFSGGSRGFSGGSSGGFSGAGLPFPIFLGGGGSCGTIVLVIVVVGVILYLKNNGTFGGGSSGSENDMIGSIMTQTPSQQASFGTLAAGDPAFSEQAFLGRVNEMFMAIQHAWQARDMEPARRFLADQQFDVLQSGVQEYVRNGQVNKLDGLHVDRIAPVSVQSEGGYDYVRVLVTATVIDYTVDERTGQIVNPAILGDGRTPKTFQEYWTLVRKQGAQTKAEASIKKCPNCGAPVTDGNYVTCAYCGTQMNDPALDWVLLRIEQV